MTEKVALEPTENETCVDVLIIGAGLSGIGAAHHLSIKSPWASYAILEARDAIGGTWDLFRYPGIRSDSDMFTFGYSLRPWDKNTSIGQGADIRSYIEDTARECGADRHIHYGHKVISAQWSSDTSRWTVTATTDETTVRFTCRFLFSCTGYYRYDRGHSPSFPGSEDFTGQIIHPQNWPEDLDYGGKRIVVIGSGATAITLVPAMADDAASVTMLQRSPSYVVAVPRVNPVTKALRRALPPGAQGTTLRWFNALWAQGFYTWCQRFPKAARNLIRSGAQRMLPSDYDIDTHFNPRYDPWDQRVCLAPSGDFFTTVREGKAEVVTDSIERFTPDGILLSSARHLEADIVVTATGLDLLFLGGMTLTVDGREVDLSERLVYKGMMLEDVPNMAIAIGYTNASWTLKADLTADFVTRLLNEMKADGLNRVSAHNDDPDQNAGSEPLLALTSGYVQRAAHLFPRQGRSTPWRVHQQYLADWRAMRGRALADPVLRTGADPADDTNRTNHDTNNSPHSDLTEGDPKENLHVEV